MNWHYAVGGNQKGPVSEQEFQSLVQQGVVTSETLVWREGMANWEPYGKNKPAAAASDSAVDNVTCAGCGGNFPRNEVITLDDRPYCAACKPLAVQRLKEGVISHATSDAEETRKQYLKHEASVKSVGLLYYLGAIALLLMGLLAIFIGSEGKGVQPLNGAIFLTLGIAQLWVGTGLRGLKKWARIPTGILSGLGLMAIPIGTLINAYILYLVFCKKGKMVFSDEYRAVIEQTPHIKYRTSIVVWILLGLVLLIIGVALTAAFFGKR